MESAIALAAVARAGTRMKTGTAGYQMHVPKARGTELELISIASSLIVLVDPHAQRNP